MERTALTLTLTLTLACATPPSPWTTNADPGPVGYDTVADPTPPLDPESPEVELSATVSGHMVEVYSRTFDQATVYAWTWPSGPPAHGFTSFYLGNETEPMRTRDLAFAPAGLLGGMTRWLGEAVMNADHLEYQMDAGAWFPATEGQNYVLHNPAKSGLVLMDTVFVLDGTYDTKERWVSWRRATQLGWVVCRERGSTRLLSWQDCEDHKPALIVWFKTRSSWM